MTMNSPSFFAMYDDGLRRFLSDAGLKEAKNCAEADMLVFCGGTDVGTPLYGEKAVYTQSAGLSQRDRVEMEVFKSYPNKFKLGICRGSQFLNCMNGGTLWQDVNNHCMSHDMVDTRTGEKITVTSTHHQMMRPNRKTGVIIGVADRATEKRSEHDHWTSKGGVFFADDHKDTEIVWYPETRSLCIQGHPEYVPGSHFAEYSLRLITQCMEGANFCVA